MITDTQIDWAAGGRWIASLIKHIPWATVAAAVVVYGSLAAVIILMTLAMVTA